MRANIFGHDDSSVIHALEMRNAVESLWKAARETLEENAELADGDVCTLCKLKMAVKDSATR